MNRPKNSPWGAVQDCDEYADGIAFVYTASHGGIVLSAARERKVAHLKGANFLGSTKYWEEDCDWSIPFVVFQDDIREAWAQPQDMFETMLAAAKKTIEHYHSELSL